ncbi:hypothetical protein GJW-30_1_00027 [Variibacter gotjawalensis]|uniref:Uncharacterized protein n=1 Tax=Variibacter gotjawalensis TaxID=1333996 RepID=A0A0S3PNH4_9BRAD|nr:hypothetical protein [Variibacter gotjawalensis]NIK47806.1 hypothetical protein [Variibacter gotjawalensis]RZS49693.1 hypothetical protein EV661_2132 [Variibacter gotjawalensis]BAT57522.1 hypothetical protein GJW-30_1_00027 [Variibacter gotjawalensis]
MTKPTSIKLQWRGTCATLARAACLTLLLASTACAQPVPATKAACAALDLDLIEQIEVAGENKLADGEYLQEVYEEMLATRSLCDGSTIAQAIVNYRRLEANFEKRIWAHAAAR